MSYKFDSLIIILNKIDSKVKVTAQSLAEELEMSERTIYRYMATLMTAGFPIEFDKNNNSYVFTDNYTLKKPPLSLEEVLAFCLAKKTLSSFGPTLEKSLSGIEAKLAMGKNADIRHIIVSGEKIPDHVVEHFRSIHGAITDRRKMRMSYRAFGAKKATAGMVDPYYLFFRNGLWYLRGLYNVDKAVRTFALDRIESLTVTNRHFLPPTLEPEEELSGAFGAFVDGDPVDVVLKFDEVYTPLITRKLWHASQKIKDLTDGGIEVTFTVKGVLGIRNWVYQWIPHVEVIAPQVLRDMFRDDMSAALKHISRE